MPNLLCANVCAITNKHDSLCYALMRNCAYSYAQMYAQLWLEYAQFIMRKCMRNYKYT